MIGSLVASVAVGHILYPVALAVTAALAGRTRVRPHLDVWPDLTVIVPAYLESGVIAAKVRNVTDNGYPGHVTILVVADGDAATAAAARSAGADVILLERRGGKSRALNAGVEAAETEWIVFSDANTEIVPGSLAKLVSWLDDQRVGAVAGEKLEGEGGELAYWRFTSWIKRNEWRLGSTIALDGGLCAVRRSAWRPIPADISCDDFWISVDMADRGHRVAYEPEAAVREQAIGSFGLSWERRTRVLGSGLWVIWRKRHLLSPRRPAIAAELWGHKLWRSTLGPLSHAALIAIALTTVRSSKLAGAFLAVNAVGAAAVVAESRGRNVPRIAGIIGQITYLQAVAFGGMARFAAGDKAVTWKKPAR